jgi:hypothetical protein
MEGVWLVGGKGERLRVYEGMRIGVRLTSQDPWSSCLRPPQSGYRSYLPDPRNLFIVSACTYSLLHTNFEYKFVAVRVPAMAPGIGSDNGRVQSTYESSRSNLYICLSVSSH